MADASDPEAELKAMKLVFSELNPLPTDVQRRVIAWVAERLNIALTTDERSRDGGLESGTRGLTGQQQAVGTKLLEGTVDTALRVLGGDSPRAVLLAAAVHLTLFQGKDKFTRDEMLATAKASRAWKADSVNQMYTNLQRMLEAKQLNEKAKNVFTLSSKTLAEMEEKFAE